MKNKEHESKDILTAQESENIDLAEKGIASPINPTRNKMPADAKDRETILSHLPSKKKRPKKKRSA